MVDRLIKLTQSNSFFVFGARGTGKSTLIREQVRKDPDLLYIDLLDPQVEDRYRLEPSALAYEVRAKKKSKWVVIDEVQKLPRLLEVVQSLIEGEGQKFILSGSSARKLKRGSANLLAGRAFVYHLYPFTSVELGAEFELDHALQWGLLPKVTQLVSVEDKKEFLRAYALTYLKEEIQAEQIVRNLDPFRHFLEVAAQMNGKIVNFSRVARDVGVETTTVQNYYSILEDTLVGSFLPAFHRSIRKRQRQAPKFHFFDPGIVRALTRRLDLPVTPRTSNYGEAFEHFLILELRKLADYGRKDWEFSYLRTKDDVEIDLIIDRPGERLACIEIKSTTRVTEDDLASFARIAGDLPKAQLFCFSNDPSPKRIGRVECFPWQAGLAELGLGLIKLP